MIYRNSGWNKMADIELHWAYVWCDLIPRHTVYEDVDICAHLYWAQGNIMWLKYFLAASISIYLSSLINFRYCNLHN